MLRIFAVYQLTTPEEEKKILAPLLGKLYVSPASSEDKIRALYADVSDAVDSHLLADATSRNALYKIHVSLGKIVNSLDQPAAGSVAGRRSTSRATSLGPDDRTVLPDHTVVEPHIKEEDEEDEDEDGDGDGDDVADVTSRTAVLVDEDSLVDDLLDD